MQFLLDLSEKLSRLPGMDEVDQNDVKVDRRVRWQRKMIAAGRCPRCGRDNPHGGCICPVCATKEGARRRARNGTTRVYNSLNRRLAAAMKNPVDIPGAT